MRAQFSNVGQDARGIEQTANKCRFRGASPASSNPLDDNGRQRYCNVSGPLAWGMATMNAQQHGKFVAYYRVSADRQNRRRRRLHTQRKAVAAYLNGGAGELVGEFTETESRKQRQRPALDNPRADKATIHILAAVAQHGRQVISQRTKAALAAAKASGKKLGTRDPKRAVSRMATARAAKAQQFAASVLPTIRAVEALGFTSNAAIAAQLNARNVPTARGKAWTHAQVGRVRSRSLGLSPQFAASVLPMIRALEALGFTSNEAIAAELNARNVPTERGKKWTQALVRRARSRSSRHGPIACVPSHGSSAALARRRR